MNNYPSELQLSCNHLRMIKEYKDLSDKELEMLAKQLIEIGAEAAVRYVGADVVEEATKRGLKVNMRYGGLAGGKLIRGFYDHSIKTITTFVEGIEAALETPAAEALGIEGTVEKIREVLMWHEFFHVLEFTELGLIGKNFTVDRKILFFNTKKPVYAVSEVCANAFCMRVMQLRESPFLIDHLYHCESEVVSNEGEASEENYAQE